ncbi:amidohydrolase family protein [Streptomyces endophytica]|uniref:Amidohydrolase family protein n=1 Tax=Streptomyces endophytica TaxID=2991496 RepID=A0ABY6P949_9ACTN|nr:amidohydrolase family protein [Streptomyces endophytica]UZJ30311.1 amidohydrolase family protein [Streptomyces endophytica]
MPELLLLPQGPVRDRAVLVSGGTFRAVGPAGQLIAAHRDLEPVRLDGHLLMPGFVDAHHHLTQSFGKAQSFGQPSEIFKTVWEPLEHALDEESAYVSAKLAALEALRGGFTTVADAGTRAPVDVAAIAKGTEEAGIRCVLSKIVSDGTGGPAPWHGGTATPSSTLPGHRGPRGRPRRDPQEDRRPVHRGRRRPPDPRQRAPRLRGTLVEERRPAPRRIPPPHRRPGPAHPRRPRHPPHPTEMRLLADSGAAISYNPVASAWKGNGVAHATMLAALGVRFGMGTDGTRGDGFRLIDAGETAQRLAYGLGSGDSVCGAGRMWLDHATTHSADAVGLGKVTGEIAAGKAADYLVVDLDVPELTPSYDLRWELVRLANRDQIAAVVVAGRLRLWHGRPTDWDAQALVARAAKLGPQVVERAKLQRVEPVYES